ncbi:MAG: MBL fold metallo-hydrolase [Gammaproteobacteria bacterium]|nr:MBL fold metallo-hydrolase [Gammaproteobacteria bacterium]MCP5200764.1 MBL fold metallo-hydrolase [Gammaproteobacteria bacterium]
MSEAYLRFWGVRGSYAAPHDTHLGVGGNTSCVELRWDDTLLVCDGGTGIISLGEELMQDAGINEMMVVFTHYHWDHICGLPFFQPAFSPAWRIKFFGPGDTAADIEKRLSDQMKAPYFPVETETWMADIQYVAPHTGGLRHGPFEIRHFNVHHPGVTYGYRIRVRDKTVVYVSDNEVQFLKGSIAKRIHEFEEDEHELLERMVSEQRTAEVGAIENVDILIHDAQYTPHDYNKKRGWGHSCYVDTVHLAIDAGVRCLYLYHHDPTYNDDQVAAIHRDCLQIIRERKSDMECLIGREGMKVPL